jgi:hypothetical protein
LDLSFELDEILRFLDDFELKFVRFLLDELRDSFSPLWVL